MSRAVALSRRGFPAPNPRVGCVVVKDGVIVGEGYHDHAGGPHAEVVALERAGGRAQGADVYVTLEPCAHRGRTPPCTEALLRANVRRVVFAVKDPNPKAEGGAAVLRDHGIDVVAGVLETEARKVNAVFLTAFHRRRPFVCVKAAVTLDGLMARKDGTSQWITGPSARAEGHRLRAEMGAVLVGSSTVIQDDPQLTARLRGVKNQPLRVILDGRSRLTGKERVFSAPGAWWIVAKAKAASQTEAPTCENGVDLNWLMSRLWDEGHTGLLVEGGPSTILGFLRAGLVDRLDLFLGPELFGDGHRFLGPEMPTVGLDLVSVRKLGPDAHLTYFRR